MSTLELFLASPITGQTRADLCQYSMSAGISGLKEETTDRSAWHRTCIMRAYPENAMCIITVNNVYLNSPFTRLLARGTRIRTSFSAPCMRTLLATWPVALRCAPVLLRARQLALMLAEKSFLTWMGMMRHPGMLVSVGIGLILPLTIVTLGGTIPTTACHDSATG